MPKGQTQGRQGVEKAEITKMAERDFFAKIKKEAKLSLKEEAELVMRARRENDRMARDKLIRSNLRLVTSIARKYCNRGISFLDLVEEGVVGLIIGIDKFNPDSKNRVSTYVTWWIRAALERAIVEKNRLVRVACHRVEKYITMVRIGYGIEGHAVSDDERDEQIAMRMGKTVEWVMQLRKDVELDVVSLTSMDDEGEDMHHLAPELRHNPEEVLLKKETGIAIKMLDKLKPRQRYIVLLRQGLIHMLDAEDIAMVMGIDLQNTAEIETAVAEKLRPPDGVLYNRKLGHAWIRDVRLDELTKQECFVMGYCFGRWQHDEPITLIEIGRTLGVTEKRVQQIWDDARSGLKRRIEAAWHRERLS